MVEAFYILVALLICFLSFVGGVYFQSKIEKRKFKEKKKALDKKSKKLVKKTEKRIIEVNQEFLRIFEERKSNADYE